MKKFLGMVMGIAMLFAASVVTAAPIGYPGSTWGEFVAPSSVIKGTPEDNNWIYQGSISQGVDWFKFGADKKWTFDTYGRFGFSLDRNRLSYNNKIAPAVGAKVVRSFSNGAIDAGVEYVYQRHFGDIYDGASVVDTPVAREGYGARAYVSYWFGWNLGK